MRSVRINLGPKVVAGRRIAAVDELKGLAIILILLYHGGAVLGDDNEIHGEVGVDIFLILSGFTLALNSALLPLGEFFKRRILRIYPSYWIALALFVWMLHHFYGQSRSWETIWQHAVGIHAFSRLAYFADISDSFWFISMILAAYVVFAAIRKHLDNLSLLFAVTGFLTLLATVIYQENGHFGGLISLAVRIPSFFVGVIAGRLLGAGTGEVRFDLFLGLGLLCFYYLTFYRGIACNYTLPAIGIILTWVGLRRYLLKAAEGRFVLSSLSLLGLISYEVYLFHQPFIRDYNVYLFDRVAHPSPTHWQILEGIFIGLAATLLVSVVVHGAVSRVFTAFTRKPVVLERTAEA
jgi:exopolysaccharide production protein ExoZ